jgi:hypothetical protein
MVSGERWCEIHIGPASVWKQSAISADRRKTIIFRRLTAAARGRGLSSRGCKGLQLSKSMAPSKFDQDLEGAGPAVVSQNGPFGLVSGSEAAAQER